MCLKSFPLMLGRVHSCFFLIWRHFFLSTFIFYAYVWRFWHFWPKTLGQRPPEASLTISLDWKSVWNTSKWCLADSWVVFSSFEKLFALTTFICYVYIGDFEILGVETLRREFSGEKFGTWVAWIFRLGSLLLKCCPNMPWDGAKEFPLSINFWKKLGQIESTVFKL